MLHPRSHLHGALSLLLAGCVLPRDGATGVELRWHLPEGNLADAPGSPPRLRSCDGALVTGVLIEVVDIDDPARRRSFSYLCEVGDSEPAELVTDPARIFIDLRPGDYSLALRWLDDPGERDAPGPASELGRRDQTLAVTADGITAIDLALTGPLLPWTLDLRNTAACTQLTLEIYYADPNADLHPLATGETGTGLYRTGLTSHLGLPLGRPIACATLLDGPQRFPELDRGEYRLRLDIDGRTCERDFTVDLPRDDSAALAVDLAKPGCAG